MDGKNSTLNSYSKPFNQAREQHDEKRSVLLLGKRQGHKSEKVALLIAPKWIFIRC
jgi:hypothetical protein